IIGALFKIMHFPGAGPVLMTGMITESLLFMIGVLDKPHQEFHWENVFPQVCGYGTEPEYLAELQSRPRPTLLGAGSEEGTAPTQTEAKQKANVPALTDDDMKALKEGIDGLAKTAVQLQDLGKVAVASNKLGEKMEAAGEKVEAASDKMAVIGEAAAKFAASSDAVSKKNEELSAAYGTIVTDMQGVVTETKNLQKGIEGVGTKLSSLNSVYELQLAALQAQVDAYKLQTTQVNAATDQVKAMTADVLKMQASINEAAKEQAAYEASAKKLAQQVADLNKVYGNMLSALA
ncbi:MAG: gliding motility protein GldL, partial [Paludibacteraceae bacterium]|nr:gliding motility protein GldL [Paludibacteraceae bacterium]